MSETEQNIRMECLRLAIVHVGISVSAPEPTIKIARQLSDFVLGTNDAEVIRAARELASRVKGE